MITIYFSFLQRRPISNFYRFMIKASLLICIIYFFLASPSQLFSQNKITTPFQQFGFNVGDDYTLISYKQLVEYWQKLEIESDRMKLVEIGKTAEGRAQIMAIITAPKNFENLDSYKSISKKLALANEITNDEAKELSKLGKAIIWIDGGLHSTEVVGANQLIEMCFQMINNSDEETLRFLEDIILLLVPANPDGQDLVAEWYMREQDPKKRIYNNIPRLYQKYIGHDNNRDSYMVNQPETENMSLIMYKEWFPQIMYNHHQTGPSEIIVFVPPFREFPNHNYDPLLIMGNQSVGDAIHTRLIAENKPGSGMRSTATYSTWFNGSLRTTGYFKNQIGILTEIKGSPNPIELSFFPDYQLTTNDLPYPHSPKKFHFREAIDYSITMNKAVLDYASRNKESLLYNRYLMGRNSIEKGSKDSWTIRPKLVEEVKSIIKKETEKSTDDSQQPRRRNQGSHSKYFELFRKPENRDPRGYIIPISQKDFPTAIKFVNTLIKNGIIIHKAVNDFSVNGKKYLQGSIVVKCDQAFRPHILDMFEPQDHPNDFKFEDGPPIPPYDNAGYTLALQMGVEFDKIFDALEGPFETINGYATVKKGGITRSENPKAILLKYDCNDAVIVVNRLLKNLQKVFWFEEEMEIKGSQFHKGTFLIYHNDATKEIIDESSLQLGIHFTEIDYIPEIKTKELKFPRIGLWDRYGGSMPSGWTRWLFEKFEFPFEIVFPRTLDAGDFKNNFDVLIFVDGAIPNFRSSTSSQPYSFSQEIKPETIPSAYHGWLGRVTADTTIPKLKEFLDEGGSIITIGSSTNLAYHLGLPINDHLVNSNNEPLSRNQYYIPASILNIRVNNQLPIAYGLNERVNIMFEESPVFRLQQDFDKKGIQQIAWFDNDRPLKSGWAWGQDKLFGGTAIAQAKIGNGNLFLFGPEIIFRGQAHGTYKFLFNGIYLSVMK